MTIHYASHGPLLPDSLGELIKLLNKAGVKTISLQKHPIEGWQFYPFNVEERGRILKEVQLSAGVRVKAHELNTKAKYLEAMK